MIVREYFTKKEMKCPCCGLINIDQEFLDRLYAARIIAGIPFYITSWCRCRKHNSFLDNASKNSSHIAEGRKNNAVDIACTNNGDRDIIINALKAAGFTRIGIRKDFIHVDLDYTKKQKRMWVY